jgi:hypothetical protein
VSTHLRRRVVEKRLDFAQGQSASGGRKIRPVGFAAPPDYVARRALPLAKEEPFSGGNVTWRLAADS